ncbi:hypothetical protein FB451DRAFT_1482040 [Mycena latifolia]|nr:hypothetical protein FB451DRAFT_1482040 [Mycena latifolia]
MSERGESMASSDSVRFRCSAQLVSVPGLRYVSERARSRVRLSYPGNTPYSAIYSSPRFPAARVEPAACVDTVPARSSPCAPRRAARQSCVRAARRSGLEAPRFHRYHLVHAECIEACEADKLDSLPCASSGASRKRVHDAHDLHAGDGLLSPESHASPSNSGCLMGAGLAASQPSYVLLLPSGELKPVLGCGTLHGRVESATDVRFSDHRRAALITHLILTSHVMHLLV